MSTIFDFSTQWVDSNATISGSILLARSQRLKQDFFRSIWTTRCESRPDFLKNLVILFPTVFHDYSFEIGLDLEEARIAAAKSRVFS
jgi:hypothetical protein